MPKTIRHTVQVRGPLPGQPPTDPQIVVEFYRSGEHVETRSYFSFEQELIGQRITTWIVKGELPAPK